MPYCPDCGSDKVASQGGNDGKWYPHPTAQGVLEKFMMILCKKCKCSSNVALAKQEDK